MDLKKQLPLIGEEQPDGFFKYGDHKNSKIVNERPEYENFKTGVYKSEPDCVSVLIGWRFISGLWKIITDREDQRAKEGRGVSYLMSLFLEIRLMLDDGLAAGAIRFNQPAKEPGDDLFPKDEVFFNMRRLHFADFLAWAEQNGYPIPPELKTKQQEGCVIPVAKNTSWEQITMKYVNDERIEITTPGNGMSPFTPGQLGLKNKRMLLPLFRQFAEAGGYLKPKINDGFCKSNISNLRKHLRQLFPDVNGKSIEDYNKTLGYVCNFNICKAKQ